MLKEQSGRAGKCQGETSIIRMRLLFIYGPVAAGKLTIARLISERTGLPLFHNHIVVDAVATVFPYGSEAFVRLRELFWLETISAAAEAGRSLIFTFAPSRRSPVTSRNACHAWWKRPAVR